MTALSACRWISLALLFFVGGSSCRDATAPAPDRVPAALHVVNGDEQHGTVGEPLPASVAVRVVNRDGLPVAGQLVTFHVVAGGGTVFAGAALSDAEGMAREQWTLGTSTAAEQRLEVRIVDASDGRPLVLAAFTARPTAGPVAALRRLCSGIVADDELCRTHDVLGDTHEVGTAVSFTPGVIATDRFGNTVPDVPVSFAVVAGGGHIVNERVSTDALGRAAGGAWTVGTVAGGPNRLLASATAVADTVSFLVIPVAGRAAQVTILATDGQALPAGRQLPGVLRAAVRDRYGNDVPESSVRWHVTAGGGCVRYVSNFTEYPCETELGASLSSRLVVWRLGSAPGVNALRAVAIGMPDVFADLRATGT